MDNFLTLEGGFLAIATFFLLITAFVTTRSFMSKGTFKKIFPVVFIFLALGIAVHYYVTTKRMQTVQEAFENNKIIICESRSMRKMSRTILIEKSKNWRIENNIFVSDDYERGFHTARCLVDFQN